MDEDKQNEPKPGETMQPGYQIPASEAPKAVVGAGKKSWKKPLLIGLIAALVIGGGAYAYTQMNKDDTQDSQNNSTTQETASESEPSSQVPAGYKEFKDEMSRIAFWYPESWGDATLKQGEEERMEHLTAGSQKVIVFSNNSTIVGGIMSNDWTHGETMGHGGIGEPGAKTMEEAKKPKETINPSNIYVDTDTQFAWVGYCADMCSSDEPRTQITYSIAIDANTDYEVIQFIQAGDPLGDEFIEDGVVDYEKLEDADLSNLFKKTDPGFVELQKLADSVKGI